VQAGQLLLVLLDIEQVMKHALTDEHIPQLVVLWTATTAAGAVQVVSGEHAFTWACAHYKVGVSVTE
jgi:hypothetical protein